MRRVVITGIGAVTPLGNTAQETMTNLREGKNGIAPISRFDANETGITVAGEVKDFDPTLYMAKKDVKRMDMYSVYAIAAAEQALQDSGLIIDESNTGPPEWDQWSAQELVVWKLFKTKLFACLKKDLNELHHFSYQWLLVIWQRLM